MVIDELEREIIINKQAQQIMDEIESLMRKKEPFEDELTELNTKRIENEHSVDENTIESLQKNIAEIDVYISSLIKLQQNLYNPRWGQLMRAGNEESYFAHQVDRYACVYMSKIHDLLSLSPRTYFRSARRPLAHELY